MSGKEALAHIRKVEACSPSAAIKQLQSAISDGLVRARLPDPENPSRSTIFPPWPDPALLMLVKVRNEGSAAIYPSNVRYHPSSEHWRAASIRVKGIVQFRSGTPWYKFEVVRADVLRIWPAVREHPPTPEHPPSSEQPKARHVQKIRVAIAALWPGGVPPGLRAVERNDQIRKWLVANRYRLQSPEALARAVQRALKLPTRQRRDK
jgi:hypothetical protein